MTIGVAATFRDEKNALPGFLESASQFFDHILLVDCSPGAKPSTDGSREIIEQWGLPEPLQWDLNEGFGAVRSRLIQSGPCDWTVILDIDERINLSMPVLTCNGEQSYPEVPHPELGVGVTHAAFNQRDLLKKLIADASNQNVKTVRMRRRHWFDFTYTHPTQNWLIRPDWQLRCMKSRSSVGYTVEPKMHEQAWDSATKSNPAYVEEHPTHGPFIDHFHCFFKVMEPEQRAEDIRVYDALHFSEKHTPIPA